MRKALIIMLIIAGIAAAITVPIVARSSQNYARITDLDFTAVVIDEKEGDNGKVRITERMTFDVHAYSEDELFWEFWRALPESRVDGADIRYTVRSVKMRTASGQEIVFEEASKLYTRDDEYVSEAAGLGPYRWYHSRNYECVMFYVNGLYRTTVEFEVVYDMYNASLRYSDCSVLNLLLFDGSGVKHLNSVKGQILFPDATHPSGNKMPSEGNYTVYTYGTKTETFPVQKSATANDGYFTLMFELDEDDLVFNHYNRHIEFSLLAYNEDKHVFTEYAYRNYYYSSRALNEIRKSHADYLALPRQYAQAKRIVAMVLAGIGAIVLLSVVSGWKRTRREYSFYKPEREYQYYQDIPTKLDVNFAAALTLCKHKMSDSVDGAFSAAMLSLIRKRYIELDRVNPRKKDTPANTKLTVLPEVDEYGNRADREPLTQTETLVHKLVVRHAAAGMTTLTAFQHRIANDYTNTENFANEMLDTVKEIGFSQGYFQTSDYKKPKIAASKRIVPLTITGIIIAALNAVTWLTRLDFLFGGLFVLGGAFIAAAVLTSRLYRDFVLLTQFGEDEYVKWRGLYRFLNQRTFIKDSRFNEVDKLEEFLVYATAFGISDKVIKALNVNFPELRTDSTTHMGLGRSYIFRNSYIRSRGFTRVYCRSLHHTTHRAVVRSHRSRGYYGGFGGGSRGGHSSRGGFGGGFGGGSRGGGGGG